MAGSSSGVMLGGYRIEERIGRGGMGVVYRATHLALDRDVALKVIAEELAEDEGFRERFRREPKLAASIDHPNVIPVFDAGEASEQLFVAMRYVDGSDLRSLIADEGRLDAARAARIVAQVAEALDAAHALGLVHRDVKPANVLIENRSGREHVYLTDFGLTKGGEGTTALTKTGQWVGTPDYVAPEQIHGGLLDRRTDIYALGAVLYHTLSGQPPYGRETEVAKIYAHLSKPPPELPGDVDAPPQLGATIRRAMAKEPGERYSSAGELGRDVLAAVGITGPATGSEGPGPTRLAPGPGPTVPAAPISPAPGETAPAPAATAPAAGTAAPPAETATPPPETATPPPETTTPTPAPAAAPLPDTARGPHPTVASDTGALRQQPAATLPAQAAPPPPRPGERRSALADRRIVAAIAAGAIIAFGALGFLLGNSGGGGAADATSFSNTASAGGLELRYPGGWQPADQAKAIPGVTFAEKIDLASGAGNGLSAGQVKATGSTLLPAGLNRALGGKVPASQPVKLGDLAALRYSDLKPKGFDGTLTIFTVPTTAGVATVACSAAAGESVSDQCQQIGSTLRLLRAQAFPIGPDPRYAKALDAAIGTVNRARTKKLKQARKAKQPSAQATSFADLAQSYARAARRLGRARVSPAAQPANSAIAAALGAGRDAYGKIASAAKANDTTSYDAGRADARRAEARLSQGLRRLSALGYTVKGQKA